ncbi:MAG: SH3 domain-containing protein [Treponema sp.]|nr:SH3 domain-containing protein [Treponema sp.]
MNIKIKFLLISLSLLVIFSSCSRMGYGVLLWSVDDPPIDSGTVLPVYIKSNIERIWVVGLPDGSRSDKDYKLEVPLANLEFVGSKKNAIQWANDFSQYAMSYAENLQDRLPIRDNPDNNARSVYRLRLGEVIKILGIARGVPPISATGEPLPGDWYKVMTVDGVVGFCFSYRLKIFEQNENRIQSNVVDTAPDPELEMVLSRIWSAETYLQMINSRRINIQEMEKKYRFDPGHETGVARIIMPDFERQFTYSRISSDGERAWNFDGTNLQMVLRPNNTLAVQFQDTAGVSRTLTFVNLPADIDSLILQENARRENQYLSIFNQGPVFTSSNFGTITLLSTGGFTWTGYEVLVPDLIPAETRGLGRILMDLYITPSYEDRFDGAFTMQFTDIRNNNTRYFLYSLDNQGLRLELVPTFGIENITVTRRDSSPMVLYFFRDSP